MYNYKHTNSSLTAQILNKYIVEKDKYCFVETGTNIGAGVKLALSLNIFAKIYSIEIQEDLYNIAKPKFVNNSNVILYKGDSSIFIKDICDNENLPCCFYLDAHQSVNSTLKEEIAAILNRNNNNDIIMVDDIRIIKNNTHWGKAVFSGNINNLLCLFDTSLFDFKYENTVNAKNDLLVVKYK